MFQIRRDPTRRGNEAQKRRCEVVAWGPWALRGIEWKGSSEGDCTELGRSTQARGGGLLLLQAPTSREEGGCRRSRCESSHPTRHAFFLSGEQSQRLQPLGRVYLNLKHQRKPQQIWMDRMSTVRLDRIWLCHTHTKEWNNAIWSSLMDLEIIMLNQVSQRQISWYHLHRISKNDTNEHIYKTEMTQRHENNLMVATGKGGARGRDNLWFGINRHTLLYIELINHEDLLYSTGN